MDRAALPSADEWTTVADISNDMAEIDWEELTWDEVIEAISVFCGHPVVIFASRFCDVVRGAQGDE